MTVSSYLLLAFDTFNSFVTGLGQNQVCGAFCSAQTANKLVQTSSAKQKIGAKKYCPNIVDCEEGCL